MKYLPGCIVAVVALVFIASAASAAIEVKVDPSSATLRATTVLPFGATRTMVLMLTGSAHDPEHIQTMIGFYSASAVFRYQPCNTTLWSIDGEPMETSARFRLTR